MNKNLNESEILELPIEKEVIFTNYKGIETKLVKKRQKLLLKKVLFIKPFLQKDEKILLITTGCSPMSFLEQYLMGWSIIYIKRALFIFTNKRIFHIPTTLKYEYRGSIAQILYADCEEIKLSGHSLRVKYKNNKVERFYYIPIPERKKIKKIIENILFEGSPSRTGGRVHLCPRCMKELDKDMYVCSNCQLKFKNKKKAKKLSILFPGGGYFYSGHPILGIMNAIAETILVVFTIIYLIGAIHGIKDSFNYFIFFLIMFFLEKLVAIYHSNQFINEYIPLL